MKKGISCIRAQRRDVHRGGATAPLNPRKQFQEEAYEAL